MGGVLHPELQGDSTVRGVETPDKMKSKCPWYFHVLDPREMLPDTDCLGKTAPGATTGRPCHARGERLQMHTAFHASAISLVCSETRPEFLLLLSQVLKPILPVRIRQDMAPYRTLFRVLQVDIG